MIRLTINALVLGFAVSNATAAPKVVDGVLGDDAPGAEISTAELRAALEDPTVIVLDARPIDEFGMSHIPGARNVAGKAGLPASQYMPDLGAFMRMVPDRAQQVVLYCNGLYCGRSKRFAVELGKAGYTRVRRYQLGIPGWRALGGVAQTERDALVAMLALDGTAVLVDARAAADAHPPLARARNIPIAETTQAKDDGRLPMTDHNTRIVVVGADGTQARTVAEAIVRDAFHNVAFFEGRAEDLPELHVKTRK